MMLRMAHASLRAEAAGGQRCRARGERCSRGRRRGAAGPRGSPARASALALGGLGAGAQGAAQGLTASTWQALLLVVLSELGDKTFFVAVILSVSRERLGVFAGSFGALAVMTLISAAFGRAVHLADSLLPSTSLPLDDLFASALLIAFGVQALAEGGAAVQEEETEAREATSSASVASNGTALVLGTFAFVFAAEWGDKSFLATVALAAAHNPYGVALGAIAGHGATTVLAVAGGSFLGKYVSERYVSLASGGLFLLFAAFTLSDVAKRMHLLPA